MFVCLCVVQLPARGIPLVNSLINMSAEQRAFAGLTARTPKMLQSIERSAAQARVAAGGLSIAWSVMMLAVAAAAYNIHTRRGGAVLDQYTLMSIACVAAGAHGIANAVAAFNHAKKHKMRARHAAALFKKMHDSVFLSHLGFKIGSKRQFMLQIKAMKKAHGTSVGAQFGVVVGALYLACLSIVPFERYSDVAAAVLGSAAFGAMVYALTNLKKDIVRKTERTQGIVDDWQEELDDVALQREDAEQESVRWGKKADKREHWGDHV